MNYEFEYPCGNDWESNPYAVLGIKSCEHNQKIIRKSGKELRAALHPDKNPQNQYAQQSFVIAQSATDILKNPYQKKLCDSSLLNSNRCFRKQTPEGSEGRILKKFHRRQAQLRFAKFLDSLEASLASLKDIPRSYYETVSKFVKRVFKTQSGRVRKAYRDFKRWPYGRRAKEPSKTSKPSRPTRSSKTSAPAAAPSRTTNAIKPQDDESPARPQSSFPIAKNGPTKTFTVTETETVTKTETETETVTLFGVNFAEHRHNAEQFVRSIDAKYLVAGVAIVICAAGCSWEIRRRLRRRALVIEQDMTESENDESDDGSDDEDDDEDDNDTTGDNRGGDRRLQNTEPNLNDVDMGADDHVHLRDEDEDDLEDQDNRSRPDSGGSVTFADTDGLEAGVRVETIEEGSRMDVDEEHADDEYMTDQNPAQAGEDVESEPADLDADLDVPNSSNVADGNDVSDDADVVEGPSAPVPSATATNQTTSSTPKPKAGKMAKTPRTQPLRRSTRLKTPRAPK